MARAKQQAQISMEEDPLEDPELSRMLDDRESAKEEMRPYRMKYIGYDKAIKSKIETLELQDGTYRCGGFIIKVTSGEGKHIEFDRLSSRRVSIRPAKE